MSLPDFKAQTRVFGIYGAAGLKLDPGDRYRLFAEKIYPLLVEARGELEKCYCPDNGRPSVEPVLLMGVILWQFVEKVPDRETVERLRYHLGWKYALNHDVCSLIFLMGSGMPWGFLLPRIRGWFDFGDPDKVALFRGSQSGSITAITSGWIKVIIDIRARFFVFLCPSQN